MSKIGGLKVVLFDLDNTLFPSYMFSSLARKNAIKAMIASGLKTTQKKGLQTLQKIIDKKGSNYSRHFDELTKHFECKNKDYAIAAGVWAYHCTKASICPFEGVVKLLNSLRKKGYTLCIASQGFAVKQWDKLIYLGLDMSFEHVFITKPSTKTKSFYAKIAKKLKLNPEQILMVGDNPKDDILAAKSAGLKTAFVASQKHGNKCRSADVKISSISSLRQILL